MSIEMGLNSSAIIGSIAARETFASSAEASSSPDGRGLSVRTGTKPSDVSSELAYQLAAARENAPSMTAAAYRTSDPIQTLSPLYSVRKFIF